LKKSAFHTSGVGRTKWKGTTTTIYCGNTSSGEHSISSRKKSRRKSSWSPAASIFCQQSTISNKAEVPTLTKTCIHRIHNSMKAMAIFRGAPNYSG
jgi:hypothetical protein